MVTLAEVQAERARREQERTQTTMRGAALAGNGSVTIEDIRRERARRASAARETAQPQRPTGYTPAAGAVASLSRGATFGAAPAMEGVYQATGAALTGRFSDIIPSYRRGVDQVNQFADTFARESAPGVGVAYEVGGGLMTGGALQRGVAAAAPTLERMATGRGLGAFGAQTVQSGVTGAGAGAVYAANTRGIEAAPEGALMGGAFGAAAPAAVNIARPIVTGPLNAIAAAGRRIQVDPNALGSNAGNVRIRPPAQPPGPRPPSGALGRGVTLAERARMGSEDLARRSSAAPEGAAVVDLFGDTGVRTLRPIAQAPGTTGARATQVAEDRFNEAPSIIMNALRRRLGVGESRMQAMARLADDYRAVGANMYRPIFERPMTAEHRAGLEEGINPLLQTPLMQRAIARADELFANDQGLGLVDGPADAHFGRYVHYLKLAVDDMISAGRRDGSLASNQLRQAMEIKTRLLAAMDANMPGYQQARAQWGGLAAAEDALDAGADFLTMLPEEVAASVRGMTPFELHHARIGVSDAVRRAVRGQVVGNKNVTNGVVNDPDAQAAIANVFDTPEQAAEFLDVVNSQNVLMRNAGQWGTGSQTQGNQAYQADGVVAAVADAGGDIVGGRWGNMVNRAGRQIGNLVGNDIVERSNNAFGDQLLNPVRGPEARAFVGEVIRILREREAARAATAATGRTTGAAAGQRGGGD